MLKFSEDEEVRQIESEEHNCRKVFVYCDSFATIVASLFVPAAKYHYKFPISFTLLSVYAPLNK